MSDHEPSFHPSGNPRRKRAVWRCAAAETRAQVTSACRRLHIPTQPCEETAVGETFWRMAWTFRRRRETGLRLMRHKNMVYFFWGPGLFHTCQRSLREAGPGAHTDLRVRNAASPRSDTDISIVLLHMLCISLPPPARRMGGLCGDDLPHAFSRTVPANGYGLSMFLFSSSPAFRPGLL